MKTNVVKLPKPDERLPQLNVELSLEAKRKVKMAAASADKNIGDWAAAVLEWAADLELKGKRPFDVLLTPSTSNVHDNGIVGVAGSIPVDSTTQEPGKIVHLHACEMSDGRPMSAFGSSGNGGNMPGAQRQFRGVPVAFQG